MGETESVAITKRSKLATGIEDLDAVLEGGYANPANVMLLGPSGMEKAAFAFHFLAGKKTNETAYCVTADATPEGILQKAVSMGIGLPPTVKFIDCYSSTLGKQASAESKHVFVPGPGALNDLSLAFNEAMKESDGKRMRIVFYSLSTFMLYNPKDSILKFLQVVGGRLRKANATTLMLVEEGVHDKQLLSMVEHTMDETYTLQDVGGSIRLEIPGIPIKLPLKLGAAGITIL